MKAQPIFLMVGTMEPRKGHGQVLAAFDQLWATGVNVSLIIVGKQGWMMESLALQIQQHREFGHRLFWLIGISDEMLLRIYENATAIIAASEGEGFGLPLIEAARAKVPIIARDLPVFREVAGDHAFYFNGTTAESLSSALRQWLALLDKNAVPRPEYLQWMDWKQSAFQLINFALGDIYYREWPDNQRRNRETDRPLSSVQQVTSHHELTEDANIRIKAFPVQGEAPWMV
jgi:glycosyltransferase involved in cell wall biosynthesis